MWLKALLSDTTLCFIVKGKMCTLVKHLAQSFSSNEAPGCFMICNNKNTHNCKLRPSETDAANTCCSFAQTVLQTGDFDTCTKDNLVPLLIIKFQQRYFYGCKITSCFLLDTCILNSCLDFTNYECDDDPATDTSFVKHENGFWQTVQYWF